MSQPFEQRPCVGNSLLYVHLHYLLRVFLLLQNFPCNFRSCGLQLASIVFFFISGFLCFPCTSVALGSFLFSIPSWHQFCGNALHFSLDYQGPMQHALQTIKTLLLDQCAFFCFGAISNSQNSRFPSVAYTLQVFSCLILLLCSHTVIIYLVSAALIIVQYVHQVIFLVFLRPRFISSAHKTKPFLFRFIELFMIAQPPYIQSQILTKSSFI